MSGDPGLNIRLYGHFNRSLVKPTLPISQVVKQVQWGSSSMFTTCDHFFSFFITLDNGIMEEWKNGRMIFGSSESPPLPPPSCLFIPLSAQLFFFLLLFSILFHFFFVQIFFGWQTLPYSHLESLQKKDLTQTKSNL